MDFRKGLAFSTPIILGYFPVSVTFGVLARTAGLTELETFLCSLLIFAGASQFALISAASFPESVIVPVFLNLRHLVYSTIVHRTVKPEKPYLTAFGLTDEVFATTVSTRATEKFIHGLEIGAYSAWVFGTLAGIYFGNLLISTPLYPSLVFSITALFFVLLLPSIKRHHVSAIVGGMIAVIFLLSGLSSLAVIGAGILTPLLTAKAGEVLKWRG
ncbi:AzlC family ABC transporter permease [Geoglobus acetivorans]|uniref:Branched-chain amino acid ABC transporter permease n=1 Tax=Geoglobus acetivorans TaxID=565033 RepID=A0A0A7GFB9_GEOAI|nr:branched-chain amino acid ABC transporter permease [Geoglobus acetivorans]